MGEYQRIWQQSLDDPETFWGDAARAIEWFTPPRVILDDSAPPLYRWFVGGEMNTCYNAVDRHVNAGRGDQLAMVYDSPVTGVTREISYDELLNEVSRFASALRSLGVRQGDRVVIYMPMIPQAVIAMLGCARIGAIHSVVFGGFAARELALRIDDAKPRVVVSASCGIEVNRVIEYKPLLDAALEQTRFAPEHCVIYQRPQATATMVPERDVDWDTVMEWSEPIDCVAVKATDPLYILYTSGTTGRPKGVVRDNGGHAVALTWSMANIYDTHQGEVFWAASDVGWVVGHSYIVYAPLLAGCTTVLYEGKPVGTPDAGAYWRVIEEHRVKCLFTAPTGFRAIKREDPEGVLMHDYDLSHLQYLFLAGERTDPETYHWAAEMLGVPVIDHWWQTETGWAIAANPMGLEPLPVKPGSATVPVPGYDVRIFDGLRDLGRGHEGNIVVKLPLPPGCLAGVWGDESKFVDAYLSAVPGYYVTGDGGHLDDEGYLFVMGRVDDVINVAGHRLSTGEIEEILASHVDVAECAVIGVNDALKGQVPRGLVVLKHGVTRDHEVIAAELVALVREQLGAVASLRRVDVVEALPKTRSGKVLRKVMRSMADGDEVNVPSTIDNPAVLDHLAVVLATARSEAASAG
ncbi:MAG: propionyl-CoA synthetase [Acidobacteriota bacterium]|nr:propionyl-CoA synthetase [Acidobacteriota bacterium]MDE3147085.1 propionyl-CoA synthetase [Acidobacteriota bacterium]